jgi:hypothetical protein
MSNDDHAVEVQAIIPRDGSQKVSARGSIEKGARPSAARISGTPVLDIPGSDSGVG